MEARIEERILRSAESLQARYDGVLEHAPCGILLVDHHGRIVSANARIESDFGYRRSELVAQSVDVLVPDRLRGAHAAHRAAFGQHAGGYRAMGAGRKLLARHKDGHEFPVEIGLGEVDGDVVAAFIVDITDREQTEEALHASEARYHALFEHANDAVLVLGGAGRIRDCNLKTSLRLGLDRASIVGQPLDRFVDPEAADATRALVRAAREHGIAGAAEVPMRRADGERLLVDISASLVQVARERLVLAVLHDVTARNRLQALLVISDRMASLGMLAAGVAHEINNPLTALMLSLEYIREELMAREGRAELFARLDGRLHDARDAAERVSSVARDLTLFSRGDEERRGPVDVHTVLDATLRLAAHEIRHRARVVKDYGTVPYVMATESRLGQVFLNLLVNAAQAITEGNEDTHEIRVSTRVEAASAQVAIRISDTGSGIPEDVLKKLFTPFFTTKPVGIGTGLGLSICHRIVASFGGQIIVESTVGLGTTFCILLPAAH